MKYRWKFLQRAGLVSALLIVGVMGGFMVPLPSGAQSLPTVTVYEVVSGVTYTTSFTTVAGGTNCTSSTAPPAGFVCYSITGPTTGGSISFPNSVFAANSRWRVSSVASNNQARVLIKDSDTATDNMYITGISISSNVNATSTTNQATLPGPCSVCQVGHMTLRKTFDAGSGNVAGPFYWAVHQGGNFNAPDFNENVVNDRMVLTAKACFATGCSPDTGISVGTADTNVITTPITLGGQGGLTKDTGPTQFGTCNTANNKCKPTIKYDYAFTVQGRDVMNLTDSATGCGGTCNPGNKAKGPLPACGDTNPPLPGEQPSFLFQCAQQLDGDSKADNLSNAATGGVPAEVCGEPACIVILIEGTPTSTAPGQGPFTVFVSGDDMDCSHWETAGEPTPCQLTLDSQGNQARTFSNLQLDPPASDRTIIITGYPGSPGITQLDQVITHSNNCTFKLLTEGAGNNKTKIGATVTSLQAGACLLEMHVH